MTLIPERRIILVLGSLLFFAAAYSHQQAFRFPTPVSRLDLLHAIIEDQTLVIDRWQTNTVDKARARGHYWSDKAPGTVAIALPVFAIGAAALRATGGILDSPSGWLFTSWWTSAWILGLSFAFGGIALFRWVSGLTDRRSALITVFGLWLGGMPLAYTGALWSHTLVMGLLAVAIERADLFGGTQQGRRLALAGLCAGWALASEYTAGLVIVGIAYAVVCQHRRQSVWYLVAMGAPLLLVPAYSWATIGTPLSLPYSYQASFPEMQQGVYAIQWPDMITLGRLLFSPQRGLLLWCPFLAMVVPGYMGLIEGKRGQLWLVCALPVLMSVVISGRVWDWESGHCYGPRLLSPMLPLLVLPCAIGVARMPWLGLALAALSMLIATQALLSTVAISTAYEYPLIDVHAKFWAQGKLSHNVGQLLGLPPYVAAIIYYAIIGIGIAYLWHLTKGTDEA